MGIVTNAHYDALVDAAKFMTEQLALAGVRGKMKAPATKTDSGDELEALATSVKRRGELLEAGRAKRVQPARPSKVCTGRRSWVTTLTHRWYCASLLAVHRRFRCSSAARRSLTLSTTLGHLRLDRPLLFARAPRR
jgi:hypothetical protein